MACATLKRSLELDPLYSPRPTKRRRCIPLTTPSSPTIHSVRDVPHSPFSEISSSRLTKDSIVSSIREEMKRFHRRRQLHFGDAPNTSTSAPPSPSSSGTADANALDMSSSPTNANGSPPHQIPINKDKPLFTFRQVGVICERMVREREDKLRELYEQALSAKLSEQYDMFVKFTHDQIQRRFEATTAPSYLS